MNITNSNEIAAKWFTGKAQTAAIEAFQMLNDSLALGYWVPKASVKVPAALGKSNVAKKLSKSSTELNTMENTYGEGRVGEAWDLVHNLYFGSFKGLARVDLIKLMDKVSTPEAKVIVAKGMEFVADFAAVVVAMEHLNKVSAANKKLAMSDDKNPMGICACCFRAQKVKPTGTMFAHGYERPGFGYIVGGCPGDMFKPYEVK
jgi:hypothetical protein